MYNSFALLTAIRLTAGITELGKKYPQSLGYLRADIVF
jgi:hypothetical protein